MLAMVENLPPHQNFGPCILQAFAWMSEGSLGDLWTTRNGNTACLSCSKTSLVAELSAISVTVREMLIQSCNMLHTHMTTH